MEDQNNINDEQNQGGDNPQIGVKPPTQNSDIEPGNLLPNQTPPAPVPETADKKLYDQLYKTQLYTKTYPEFQKQFNNPQSIDKLYQGLSESELYTKPKEDFYNQFFSHLPSREVTDAHDFINNYLTSPKANKAINKITEDQFYKNIYQQQSVGAQGRDATKLAQLLPIRMADQAENDRKDFANQMQSDPSLIRPVLSQAKRQNPTDAPKINQAMYVADASKRTHSAATVKYYADQLASGKMDYDINSKQLVKPVGAFDAIFHGLKNHSDAINEYDFLTSHSDDDIIKHLDEKSAAYDPDKPIYKAKGAISSTGEMLGSSVSALGKMGAGSVATRLAGAAAPELALPIAAITTMGMGAGVQDFHHTSYANAMEETYRELRQQHPDADPHVILNEAKKQANASGAFGMAQGLIAGEVGNIAGKEAKFVPVRLRPGFTKALTDIGKKVGGNLVSLIKSSAPDVTAQTAVSGGIKAIENAYRGKPAGEGMVENMAGNALFMTGLVALRNSAGVLLGREAKANLMDGYAKAPPEIVDNTLKTAVGLNAISPETAIKTKQEIESHRTESEGMPDFSSKITPEAEHLLSHIEETGANPSSMNKKMLEKIANDNGIKPEEGKELAATDIVEQLRNKQKSQKMPKTFVDASDLLEQAAPKLTGTYKTMYEKDPEGFLKFIAEQAHGDEVNRTELEQADGITKPLIDAAIAKYPENILSPKTEANGKAENAQTETGQIENQDAGQQTASSEKPRVTVSTPTISNVRLKTKPISEMNSDELFTHAKNTKSLQSDLEVRVFGEDGAKKYRDAQNVSNSDFSSPEKRKEADEVIKEMHDSLTPKQSEEFFSKQDDPAEIRDIARKVKSVEDSADMDELSSSVRAALSNMDKNNPSDEFMAIMNAAKTKAADMKIDIADLVKEVVKKVGNKYRDAEDAEFMMKSALDKLTNIKPKDNAIPIGGPASLHVDEAPGNSGQMGEGIPKPEKSPATQGGTENKNIGEKEGIAPPEISDELPFGKEETTGIKNVISNIHRSERALPKVDVPKLGSDVDVLREGKELVDSGKIDPQKVVERINSTNEGMHPDEAKAMQYYMHQLARHENNLTAALSESTNPVERADIGNHLQQLSDDIDAATSANIKSGTAWSHVGNIRQVIVDAGFNPSREKAILKSAYGGELPTEVKEKLDAITKERDAAIDAKNQAEERLKNLAADKAVVKIKKEAEKSLKLKQTKEELKKEEQDLLKEIRQSIKKDLGNLHAGIPIPKETLETLGKLAVNYFKQGAITVEALVGRMYEQLKDDIEGLNKKDLRDFLAQYEPLSIVRETERITKKAEGIENKVRPTVLKTVRGKLEGVSEKPDFTPVSKTKLTFKKDPEWVKANQKLVNAEYKLKTLKREAFESKKNMYQKALMWFSRLTRLSVLSGYNVLYKLSAAATIGGAGKRIPEQAIGAIYGGIFKGISDKAPIEGMPYLNSELQFYKEFFNPKKFLSNAKEILKSGSSHLTKQFGNAEYEHIKGLYLPTDLHQIIKDPLKRGTFEASFRNGMHWAEKNNFDITDPLIVQSIENAAYKRANYEIFQEQSWLTKKFNDYKTKLDKSGNAGSTAKFLVDFMIPVSTVPTNIAKRLATTSPFGLIRGGVKVVEAYRKGIENLKPEEADAVMRQLKQGSLGTAMWLVGWFGYNSFGGLYSRFDPNKKRMAGDYKSDEMEINGEMIPKPVQHALPLEIIQLAATARRIHDNYSIKKGENEFESIYNSALGSIGAVAEQIPIIETGVHAIEATSDTYQAKKLKEDVKRRFEPQILRETGIIPAPQKKSDKSNQSVSIPKTYK